jgi:hypothetical protein
MSIARLTVCITSEPLKVVVITVVWAVSAAVVPASVVCPSTVVCRPKLVVNNEVSVIGSPDGPFEVVVSVVPVSVVCCPSVVVNNEVSVGGSPDGWFDVVELVSVPSVPSAVAVPVVCSVAGEAGRKVTEAIPLTAVPVLIEVVVCCPESVFVSVVESASCFGAVADPPADPSACLSTIHGLI